MRRPNGVAEIVLTGGPGGGKTTALGWLATELTRFGVRVITVPEVATMIINRGTFDIAEISRADSDANCRFQRELFQTHRSLRRRALETTAEFGGAPAVVIYDRGELDGRAWHEHDCFNDLAADEGTTVEAIRDGYSAVMHMVTAADGAQQAYTLANNAARWESAQEAMSRDRKVLAVWQGSPNLHVIDNSTNFGGKVDRLLLTALRVLQVPDDAEVSLIGHPMPIGIGEAELVASA